jgi:hypothetical protein
MGENLRERVIHLEGYLEANPLERPTAQALFAGQMQRWTVFFRDLIAEFDLSRLPGWLRHFCYN